MSMRVEPRNPTEAIEVMLIKEDQLRVELEKLQVSESSLTRNDIDKIVIDKGSVSTILLLVIRLSLLMYYFTRFFFHPYIFKFSIPFLLLSFVWQIWKRRMRGCAARMRTCINFCRLLNLNLFPSRLIPLYLMNSMYISMRDSVLQKCRRPLVGNFIPL